MKIVAYLLVLLMLVGALPNLGCNRSEDPQHRRQEIDRIINRVADLNAKADEYRAKALEYDGQLKAYRQEIQQLRSQTGEGKKDRKAKIQILKDIANQAKKQRKSQRLRVMVYTRKVQELVADFDALNR